jgi:hypothetical protein
LKYRYERFHGVPFPAHAVTSVYPRLPQGVDLLEKRGWDDRAGDMILGASAKLFGAGK